MSAHNDPTLGTWKACLDLTTLLQGQFCSVPSKLVTLKKRDPLSHPRAADTSQQITFPHTEPALKGLKVQAVSKS